MALRFTIFFLTFSTAVFANWPEASITSIAASTKMETRCGWYNNPTPGNIWLTDADGEWTIGLQLTYEADGVENWVRPFKVSEWVYTDGTYGYGCACMQVRVDGAGMRIEKIFKAWPRALSACRTDPNLGEFQD